MAQSLGQCPHQCQPVVELIPSVWWLNLAPRDGPGHLGEPTCSRIERSSTTRQSPWESRLVVGFGSSTTRQSSGCSSVLWERRGGVLERHGQHSQAEGGSGRIPTTWGTSHEKAPRGVGAVGRRQRTAQRIRRASGYLEGKLEAWGHKINQCRRFYPTPSQHWRDHRLPGAPPRDPPSKFPWHIRRSCDRRKTYRYALS